MKRRLLRFFVVAIAAFRIVLLVVASISIGFMAVGPLSEIREKVTLPTTVNVGQGYPCFQLVVSNRGKLAARFVKIHLEFLSVGDTSCFDNAKTPIEHLAAPALEVPNDNPFKWQNNKDFVFMGGVDWVIYSQDEVSFTFCLGTVVKEQPPVPFDYRFRCTVWAQGLDFPVSKDLMVRVKPSES
jgi:hypothetical protein